EGIADALIELIEKHPAFKNEGIELDSISCSTDEMSRQFIEDTDEGKRGDVPDPIDADVILAAEKEEEDALDDYEADAFLCRWPNGGFSIVSAPSKREAILELDEWAGAHPSQVYPLNSFKADFRLTDEGEIVLNEFGEETRNFIWETCYPE